MCFMLAMVTTKNENVVKLISLMNVDGGIRQSEGHGDPFKQHVRSFERRFTLVPCLDLHLVVSSP